MRVVRQINIKNRTNHFYNDTINFKDFESKLLKIDQKYQGINIYYTKYVTIKKNSDCENIHNVNPLYLCLNHASGYIEEKIGNEYLVFDSTDVNKKVLKKYAQVWDEIKSEIKAVTGGKENDLWKRLHKN